MDEEIKKVRGKRNQERIDPDTIDERFILNFNFTTFQKEVIKLIYEMRILNNTQISIILDRNEQYVRNQLLILYKNGFLHRAHKTVEYGKGSGETYWMLDRGGAFFIAGAYGISMKSLKWNIRDNLIKFDKLAHSLKISEIRATLEKAAKAKGHQITNCLCDRHLFFEFISDGKNHVIRPDMYFVYSDGNKIYQYFFEIDMGTMAINGPLYRTSNVISKVPKYENFKLTGAWKEHFEVYPRVVFLTTTKSRAALMAESVKEKQNTKLDFLFTTFEFFEKDCLGEELNIYLKSDGSATNLFE